MALQRGKNERLQRNWTGGRNPQRADQRSRFQMQLEIGEGASLVQPANLRRQTTPAADLTTGGYARTERTAGPLENTH